MKLIIFLMMMIFSLSACANGSKRPDYNVRAERKDQDKGWRACENEEDPEPVGKLCNAVCIKVPITGNGCKEWKVNKKNFANKEDFLFFRNAGFFFIDEDNL